MTNDEREWFADIDEDQEGDFRWTPCLDTCSGFIPTLTVWFATKAECEDFIREFVIGVGMEPTP